MARRLVIAVFIALGAVGCHRARVGTSQEGWTAGPFVTSEPPGAEILLDGQPTGRRTPGRIETWEPLLPHELRVASPGRVPFDEVISEGPPPERISAQLPVAGYLDARTEPAGARVRVGDRILGTTPATLPIAADQPVELSVALDGYVDWSGTVRAAAGETAIWNVVLPRAATAYLDSDPEGAALSLDGKPVGRTPMQLTVAADVEHLARLTRAGLTACERRFRLAWKASQRIACDLEDAEGRRLRILLSGTRERVAELKRRRAAIPDHDPSFMANIANDRARNRIDDELERLSDEEDRRQADMDAHRAEIEDAFEVHAADGGLAGSGRTSAEGEPSGGGP